MTPITGIELAAIGDMALDYLLMRGAPKVDAEDAVQNLLMNLHRRPDQHLDRITNWTDHRGYFCRAAYRQWLMLLRSEQARRNRERQPSAAMSKAVHYDPEPAQLTLFDLPGAAKLTATQARYLEMLFYQEMSISDIAEWHGVTEHAVRGVVRRAYKDLRDAAEMIPIPVCC